MSERMTTVDQIKARAVASLDGIPLWPPATRPTDEQLARAFDLAPPIGAITIAAVEMDRARESEETLLARVAALEAERAGETGTPTHYGRYWCELSQPSAGVQWRDERMYKSFGWDLPYKGQEVIRFHRLPGETYTETANADAR